MSSKRRPWFPWCPKEYVSDEKVRGLSDDADLVYRRILDCMWEASDLHLLNKCSTLANQVARGWTAERFQNAWNEIMTPGFELLKTTECGQYVYSERLIREAEKIEAIGNNRKKGGLARAQQMHSKCTANAQHVLSHPYPDPYPDIKKETIEKKKSPRSKTLIPAEFKITPEMQSWFDSQNFKKIEIQSATAKFIDYWKAQGKLMADWNATWRNGMRKAEEWTSANNGNGKAPQTPAPVYCQPKPFVPVYGDD